MPPHSPRVASLLFVLIAGCASHSAVRLNNREIDPMHVQQVVLSNASQMRSIRGEGRITVETPTMAQSGSFALVLRKPDSLLVHLKGPFGLKLGSALMTRHDFLFYNSFKNQVVTGNVSAENLGRIFKLRIEFDDVLNLFTGGTFFPEDLREPDQATVEEDHIVYGYATPNGSRRYWIDPQTLLIDRIQHLDDKQKLVLEEHFSNFEAVDGVSVPMLIRMILPRERQMLALSYSDVSLNSATLEFTLNIPTNAERIRW